TYVPDYLNGDPIPPDALNPGQTFDIMKWFPTHNQEFTRPPLDKVIAALKAEGVTSSGRYVFDLAFENVIKVGVVSHPSLLKTPDDLESKAPLLFNSAKADEVFAGFAPGYKREYFEGLTHCFALRGDISKLSAGKEGAFKSAVEWFIGKL
ncbi:hypothetical protein HYPSUDRAFT_47350, partial [Hypholoma sublateritium FD-334 SS-4]